MKNPTIAFINFYQQYLAIILKNFLGVYSVCKFSPSCSEYAKQQIKKKGLLVGGYKFLVRFLRCQPLYVYKEGDT